MKTIAITATLLLAIAAAPAPARAQNREHLQMAAELRILQQQQQELANAVAQLTQIVNEATKGLNTRIDQSRDALTKSFADQSLTVKNMADDLRAIRAQTQDSATRLGELKEEIEALRKMIPTLLTQAAPPPDSAVPADPNAPAVASVAPSPSTAGISPTQLFEGARADFGAGAWTLAIEGFQNYLKLYGTSTRADDAQQYIGDAEFQQQHFEQAIAAYNLVIKNYPKEDQVPWAYLKRGRAQEQLQQKEAARASFEAVVKQFPNTEAAQLALQGIQRIDSTPAPAAPKRP